MSNGPFVSTDGDRLKNSFTNWIKPAGEISSAAIWVKEDDVFDDSELKIEYTERDYDCESDEVDYYTYELKPPYSFEVKEGERKWLKPIRIDTYSQSIM